jgi:hypothetical protein
MASNWSCRTRGCGDVLTRRLADPSVLLLTPFAALVEEGCGFPVAVKWVAPGNATMTNAGRLSLRPNRGSSILVRGHRLPGGDILTRAGEIPYAADDQ